jgi:hypothetical protein
MAGPIVTFLGAVLVLLVGLALNHLKYGVIVGASGSNLVWGDAFIVAIFFAWLLWGWFRTRPK